VILEGPCKQQWDKPTKRGKNRERKVKVPNTGHQGSDQREKFHSGNEKRTTVGKKRIRASHGREARKRAITTGRERKAKGGGFGKKNKPKNRAKSVGLKKGANYKEWGAAKATKKTPDRITDTKKKNLNMWRVTEITGRCASRTQPK